MRLLFIVLSTSLVLAQVDVLTQRNDNARSGLNLHETILNHQSVHTKFGRLWTLFSDAKIMAEPLYVSNLKSAKCPTGCNTVIFASMKGTIYAYMADQKPQTANDTLVWARYLSDGIACKCSANGPQNGSGDFDMWAVDDPWWGVLGTPVIDRASNLIYAVTWTNDDLYRVYALSLSDGTIQKGPVTVQGSVGGLDFVENHPGFKQQRKQRAGLLLSQGSLYVAFGGDNDQALAGWLFVYDAATLALKTIWTPTPGGRSGGIWQSGQGLAADAAGNIYLQTGNGDVGPDQKRFGDSMVKLKLGAGGLTVEDFFTPCNQKFLDRCDLDQGSAGPLLFNGFIVGGGKHGKLYLMRADKLAKFKPGPWPPPALDCMSAASIPDCQDGPEVLQKWQATTGHIHGAPIFWTGPQSKSWLFLMGEGDHLKAFPFAGNKFDLAGTKHGAWAPPHPGQQPCGGPVMNWMPGGILSVTSDGVNPGTGIVWVLTPANGDANSYRGVKGMLMALNAEDVSKELWRSQGLDAGLSDIKDSFGLLARFVPPTIANGKVFVPTAGDQEPLHRWCPGARPTQFPHNYQLVVYGVKQ